MRRAGPGGRGAGGGERVEPDRGLRAAVPPRSLHEGLNSDSVLSDDESSQWYVPAYLQEPFAFHAEHFSVALKTQTPSRSKHH